MIDVVVYASYSVVSNIIAAIFQDTTAGSLAAGYTTARTATDAYLIVFSHYVAAGTTSATTFKVRLGGAEAGTFTLNGEATNRKLGGVMRTSITISEIAV